MANARQRNDNAVQVLIDLVAVLPWWGGVLLAGISYPWLHDMAQRPSPDPTSGPGSLVMHATVVGLATAGQYIVPLLCLVAAATSSWRRRARQALLREVAQVRDAQAAEDELPWRQFEQLTGEAFRRRGYGVQETGRSGSDRGVDLVLVRDGALHLVQCKHWRAPTVGVAAVRELHGVMAGRGAAGGFIVSSGRFTDEAEAFAKDRNIQLIDGPQLHAMMRETMWPRIGA